MVNISIIGLLVVVFVVFCCGFAAGSIARQWSREQEPQIIEGTPVNLLKGPAEELSGYFFVYNGRKIILKGFFPTSGSQDNRLVWVSDLHWIKRDILKPYA